MSDSEFFVPDEPVDELLAAYDRGAKGVTARPARAPQATSAASSKLTLTSGPAVPGATSTRGGRSVTFTSAAVTFEVTHRAS